MIHWHSRDEYCEYANNLGVLVITEKNEVINAVIKQNGDTRIFLSLDHASMPEIDGVTGWVDEGDVASFLDAEHHLTFRKMAKELEDLYSNLLKGKEISLTEIYNLSQIIVQLQAIINS